MHSLSKQAEERRLEDMHTTATTSAINDYCRIILLGGLYLLKSMAQKLTPGQRGFLAFASIVLGGSMIAFLLMNNMMGLALVIMFVLGILVAEISRL